MMCKHDKYWSYGAWLTVNLVSNFAEVYEMFFESTRNERLCHGWFLRYCHERVNTFVSQPRHDRGHKAQLTAANEKIFPPYQWKKLYEYLLMETKCTEMNAVALIRLMKKRFLVLSEDGISAQNPADLFTDVVMSANPEAQPGTVTVCNLPPNNAHWDLDAPAH